MRTVEIELDPDGIFRCHARINERTNTILSSSNGPAAAVSHTWFEARFNEERAAHIGSYLFSVTRILVKQKIILLVGMANELGVALPANGACQQK